MGSVPKVDIIIPVYNDPEGVETTLQSLIKQTYPEDKFQIYVVDNDSTDATPQIVQRFQEEAPNIVNLLYETEIQSSYAARNKGIKESSGDIIAFIDADMVVDEIWLERIVDSIQSRNASVMGCAVEVTSNNIEPSIFELYNMQTGFPIKRFIEQDHFVPTCCLVVRRGVFQDVGLFDDRLISGGDKEFGTRVYEAGYTIHFEPSITMYHPARDSLRAHLAKGYRLGRGKIQQATLYPDRFMTKSNLNPRFYLPSAPNRLRKKCRDYPALTITEKLGLYVILYLRTSLAYMAGRVAESIRPSKELKRPPRHLSDEFTTEVMSE